MSPSGESNATRLLVNWGNGDQEIAVLKGDLAAGRARYRKSLETAEKLAQHDGADLESRVSIPKMHVALGWWQRGVVCSGRRVRSSRGRSRRVLGVRPEDVKTGYVVENARQFENAIGGCSVGHPCTGVKGLRLPDPLN